MRRATPRLTCSAAGCGMLLIGTLAHSAWVVEPSARFETRYERNVRLDPTNHEDGYVTSADLQVRLSYVSELSRISIVAGASPYAHHGVDSLDTRVRNPMFLEASANRSWERSQMSLEGRYRREDLLRHLRLVDDTRPLDDLDRVAVPADELDDEAQDGARLFEEGDPDQGLFSLPVRRNRLSLTPGVSYEIDRLTTARLSATFADLSYEALVRLPTLQDSRSYSSTATLQRRLTERDAFWGQVTRTRFEPERSAPSDVWDTMVGWNRRMTERSSFTISAGARRTESVSSASHGVLFNVRLDQRTETGNRFLLIERSLLPDAFGGLVETDRVAFGLSGQLTDRTNWSVRGSGYLSETVGDAVRSRRYLRVGPELRWSVTPAWSLRAAYDFTWIDRERDEGTAHRNGIGLSVAYSPPRRF